MKSESPEPIPISLSAMLHAPNSFAPDLAEISSARIDSLADASDWTSCRLEATIEVMQAHINTLGKTVDDIAHKFDLHMLHCEDEIAAAAASLDGQIGVMKTEMEHYKEKQVALSSKSTVAALAAQLGKLKTENAEIKSEFNNKFMQETASDSKLEELE